jgi:hypothetical protein
MTALSKLALGTALLASLAAALPAEGSSNAAAAAVQPAARAAQDCGCFHNGDAGRWDDSMDPAGRLTALCRAGGGCYQAAIGRMCVTGDLSRCDCAEQVAADWESWHGNWFLWTAVTCGGLSVTIT